MAVLVVLEMDGDSEALLAAAADLETRRPTSAMTARLLAAVTGYALARFRQRRTVAALGNYGSESCCIGIEKVTGDGRLHPSGLFAVALIVPSAVPLSDP